MNNKKIVGNGSKATLPGGKKMEDYKKPPSYNSVTKTYSVTAVNTIANTITLSPTSLTFTYGGAAKTVAVTRNGSGAVSATSSDTGVATVSVSGTTVTVTPKNAGTSTVTVTVAAAGNYKSAPA